MPGRRVRLPATVPAEHDAPSRRPTAPLADAVLALQRTAGNAATRRALARDARGGTKAPPKPPAAAQAFRLLIVDDGDTGLSDKSLKVALDVVRAELRRVTAQSDDPLVKAGFDVQHTKQAPPVSRDTGRSSFIIFLTASTDATHAVGLAAPHVDLDADERKQQEKSFARKVASEGGTYIDRIDGRGRSFGAGLVSTRMAATMQDTKGAGPESAGNLVGEVVLHELGHALGHNTLHGNPDHDKGGIMTATRVLDSSLRYRATHFSQASVKIILARLKALASRLAPKAAP
jgi:hypothetical protein